MPGGMIKTEKYDHLGITVRKNVYKYARISAPGIVQGSIQYKDVSAIGMVNVLHTSEVLPLEVTTRVTPVLGPAGYLERLVLLFYQQDICKKEGFL